MTISFERPHAAPVVWPACDAAGWLGLAATPVFAAMSLITAVEGPGHGICTAATGFEAIHGMAWMYGLMAVFHATPWIRRFAGYLKRRQSTSQTEGN